MTNRFERLLAERACLLADGATGTNLFALGLQSGDAPELWNVEHPDRIATHYRSFIEAGSDLILTNTFGGTRYRLKLHRAQDRVHELNLAAARIACETVQQSGRDVVVAGSIGPTGEILAPLGSLTHEEAVAAFAEQANALAAGGADVMWIETMSSREEVQAAVEGASRAGLPVVCTLSFDTNGRTMMGLGAHDVAQLCTSGANDGLGHLHAFGTNCGVGASEVVATVISIRAASADADSVLVAKANCGIPEFVDGEIQYNGTPQLMAQYAVLARDAGARIVGGCCGTSPEHVRAMRDALDSTAPGAAPDINTVVNVLGNVTEGAMAQIQGQHEIKAKPRRSRRRNRPATG